MSAPKYCNDPDHCTYSDCPTAFCDKDGSTHSLQRPCSANLRMEGQNARAIIKNCHALLRHKFRGSPLWSMVSQITGHGSGYSHEICKSANLNPSQECGRKALEDDSPNDKLSD